MSETQHIPKEAQKQAKSGWENSKKAKGERKRIMHKAPEKPDEDRFRRPKSKRGKFLDYSKVDWDELASQLEDQPHGGKRPILIKWALRLKCSIDTLYRGLRKWRNNE